MLWTLKAKPHHVVYKSQPTPHEVQLYVHLVLAAVYKSQSTPHEVQLYVHLVLAASFHII